MSRFANSWTLDKYGCAEPRVFVECRFFAERYTLQRFLCRVPENLRSENFDKEHVLDSEAYIVPVSIDSTNSTIVSVFITYPAFQFQYNLVARCVDGFDS